MKCVKDHVREDRLVVGNVELQCGKESLLKVVSEEIKAKDSDIIVKNAWNINSVNNGNW